MVGEETFVGSAGGTISLYLQVHMKTLKTMQEADNLSHVLHW